MPTYDYECIACKHRFELFQKMTDKPIKKCPQCQKNKLKRLIGSGMGIIFKGSGFYETDYKRKSDNSKQSKVAEKIGSKNKENKDTQKATEQNKSPIKEKKPEARSSKDSGKEKK